MANEGSTKPTYSELETQVADLKSELEQFWNLTYVRNFEGRESILKAELAHQKANVEEMYRDCCKAERELARVRGLLQEVAEALNLPPETLDIASCNHIAHVAKQARENAALYFQKWSEVRGLLQRQWVSVEERLPEKDGWVLAAKGDVVGEKYYRTSQGFVTTETSFKRDTFGVPMLSYDVKPDAATHWMPLPAPPTFPRTSQNQMVSSGVEGAHEGTTADKSEPEKLNNAQGELRRMAQNMVTYGRHLPNCRTQKPNSDGWCDCGFKDANRWALAESSLSSPSPEKRDVK